MLHLSHFCQSNKSILHGGSEDFLQNLVSLIFFKRTICSLCLSLILAALTSPDCLIFKSQYFENQMF